MRVEELFDQYSTKKLYFISCLEKNVTRQSKIFFFINMKKV